MSTFAERLRELRTLHGLTQEELASKISSTRASIANWEGGRSEPDLLSVFRLTRLFGVSADYMLGFVDDPNITVNDLNLNKALPYLDPKTAETLKNRPRVLRGRNVPYSDKLQQIIDKAADESGIQIRKGNRITIEELAIVALDLLSARSLENALKSTEVSQTVREQLTSLIEAKRLDHKRDVLSTYPWIAKLNDDLQRQMLDFAADLEDDYWKALAPFDVFSGVPVEKLAREAFDLFTLEPKALEAIAHMILNTYRIARAMPTPEGAGRPASPRLEIVVDRPEESNGNATHFTDDHPKPDGPDDQNSAD